MIRTSRITIGLLLTLLVAGDAAAQWNVARFGTSANRIYTTMGVDPAAIGALGYARVLDVAEHPLQLATEVGVVATGPDVQDFRARLGVQTSLIQWRSLHLTGSATFVTRGTENSVYRGVNFGADLTGTVGVYRNRWFAAGEYGFDKAIITHVTFTSYYRDNFFPGAKDAWYLDTGGTHHYGATSGVTLGRSEVVGRAGWLRTEGRNSLTPPAYLSLGLGWHF